MCDARSCVRALISPLIELGVSSLSVESGHLHRQVESLRMPTSKEGNVAAVWRGLTDFLHILRVVMGKTLRQ